MKRSLFRLAACVALTGALCLSPTSRADDFPSRPISIIASFAGGSEQVVRVIARKMSAVLGQSIVVIPEPAGSGVVAVSKVARSAPDGYTLVASGSTQQILRPLLLKKPPYDPLKDFTPISQFSAPFNVIAVNRKLPVHNVAELFKYAAGDKARSFIGVFPAAGMGALMLHQLRSASGGAIDIAPYPNDNQAIVDATAGRLTGVVTISSGIAAHAGPDGAMRVIGLFYDQRSPRYEGVATLGEQIPGFVPLRAFTGFFGPAGMSPAVVAKLSAATQAALADPEVRQLMFNMGTVPQASTPEQLGELVRVEVERTRAVIQQAGLQQE